MAIKREVYRQAFTGPIRSRAMWGARLVASFLGPEYGPRFGPSFFTVLTRFRNRRTDRSHTEAKTIPHAGDGFAEVYIAWPHTSFVVRHTSTLNPNPKLQRHLDPASFLYRILLARIRKWCDKAGQNHLFHLFQHFSRSGFGLALRRCSTT